MLDYEDSVGAEGVSYCPLVTQLKSILFRYGQLTVSLADVAKPVASSNLKELLQMKL